MRVKDGKNIRVSVFALFCVVFFNSAFSGELEDRRIIISLKIFPKIVAVDTGLKDKLSNNKKVKLLLLYKQNKTNADTLAELLRDKVKNIGGNQVEIVVEKTKNVNLIITARAAGIFFTERLSDVDFEKIIQACISEQIIVFSPYAGDVERGATVGVAIGNRVRPYFNIATLKASKVNINKKLLKVSKRYE